MFKSRAHETLWTDLLEQIVFQNVKNVSRCQFVHHHVKVSVKVSYHCFAAVIQRTVRVVESISDE